MNWQIGLSGLRVSQQAMDLIGTNIANAGTEGYHKQDAQIASISYGGMSGNPVGGGAEVVNIRRRMDVLLEREILRQNPRRGEVEQKLLAMTNIEAALGDLDSENLGSAIDYVFNSFRELSSQTSSLALKEQVVVAAESMCDHFNNLAGFLDEIKQNVYQQAKAFVGDVNDLSSRIAELNTTLAEMSARGSNSNVVADQRDQAVYELCEMMKIDIIGVLGQDETLNLEGWGMPVVHGPRSFDLGLEIAGEDKIGVAPPNSRSVITDVTGGKLGAMIEIYNTVIPDLQDQLDTLAREMTWQLNKLHTQGIGESGSFTSLTGHVVNKNEPISDWSDDVTAGDVRFRVTMPDGSIAYRTVAIDPAVDSLEDVANDIDALAELNASVIDGALRVTAAADHSFDFLALPTLTYGPPWNGPDFEVSGLYEGEDDTYTVTVLGTQPAGTAVPIGQDENLQLEVRDSGGNTVAQLDMGPSYTPGDRLNIGRGLYLDAVELGDLTVGESFTIDVRTDGDETNFLTASGLNALFAGDTAKDIRVTERVLRNPAELATNITAGGGEGGNILRMAEIGQSAIAGLDGAAPQQFWQRLAAGVGHRVGTLEAHEVALQDVDNQLMRQRDEISGVDVNEQAASLMMFEKMFEGCARYLTVLDETMDTLLNMI